MDPLGSQVCTSSNILEKLVACRHTGSQERSRLEEEIVRAYLPMARRLASRFNGFGSDPDDLIQVANIGLVRAIRGFDPQRGVFESYAKATISGELKKHLRDHCWTIKPPRRVQELQAKITRATEVLAQKGGALPAPVDLAEAVDAPVSDITEALSARGCYSPSSLDRPAPVTGRPLGEDLADDEEPFERVDGWVSLMQICSELTDEEKTLLRLRFYECLSQREIASELGTSQMYVSRELGRLLDRFEPRRSSPTWPRTTD